MLCVCEQAVDGAVVGTYEYKQRVSVLRVISHPAIRIYLSDRVLSGVVKCGHYNAEDRYPVLLYRQKRFYISIIAESWMVALSATHAGPDERPGPHEVLLAVFNYASSRVTFRETKKTRLIIRTRRADEQQDAICSWRDMARVARKFVLFVATSRRGLVDGLRPEFSFFNSRNRSPAPRLF